MDDRQDGDKITDQKLFRDYAAYWEDEFFADTDALNVRDQLVGSL